MEQKLQPAVSLQDRIKLFENIDVDKQTAPQYPNLINIIDTASNSRSSRFHHHRSFSVGGYQGAEMPAINMDELRMKADELERMFMEQNNKRRISYNCRDDYEITRGKMYDKYMEKRDAKRRQSKGGEEKEKQAKTRAMWKSLEESRAELEAWRRGQDLAVEGLGTCSSSADRFLVRKKDQLLIEEEEEDKESSDGSIKSVNSRMLTSRSMPSSASRLSGASLVPKTSSKPPASRSLRLSAPENTIPRSKSTSAKITPRPSASSRKTSTPLKPGKEQTTPKPFLKKGTNNGVGLSKLRTANNFSELNDDASLCSPAESTTSLYSKDGSRARKKWATSTPDAAKGLKRFLQFGKRSAGSESKVANDCVSVSAVSEVEYDKEVDRKITIKEEISNYGMGYPIHSYSYDCFSFSEGMNLPQQVQTPHKSIPAPTNFKLRKDLLSESSPKLPRSFFSLSAFRNKGVESKLR